jgi:protein-S-isoprenylcysteine O-methyltransferase Ste14
MTDENGLAMDYLLLAALWIAWCSLHSVLISIGVTRYLKSRLGEKFRFYRLAYNATALATLLPLWWYSRSLQSQPVFTSGALRAFQLTLFGFAMALFVAGSRHYDALQFLGIRQLRDGNSSVVLTGSNRLNTRGILGVVRHPWYLGGMAFVWAVGELDYPNLVTNLILTLYLIIGAILEERKLLLEFGDEYRKYRRRVSMFFPYKWVRSCLKR